MKDSPSTIEIGQLLEREFDQKYKTVSKNGQLVPFSVDVILTDLYESGLTPIQSLKILEVISPHLHEGIENKRMIKLINQAIQQVDPTHAFVKRNYLQPVEIEFQDGQLVEFTYREIENYLIKMLKNWKYSSETLNSAVDELHRIVLSMRSDILKEEVIENMIPLILRNVIGINPFSTNQLNSDYHQVIRLSKSLDKTWEILPPYERISILILLFDSIFRIILLNFRYLPGSSEQVTINQITALVTDLSENRQDVLSDNEIHILRKSAGRIIELFQQKNPDISSFAWLESIHTLKRVVERFADEGSISWLIVIDQVGNELYGKFSSNDQSKYKSLMGMALTGVQSLVNELTDRSIKEIQQEQGSILIERRDLFSVIVMSEYVTPSIRRSLFSLAEFIENDLKRVLTNFNGKVSVIEKVIDDYIEVNLTRLFKSNA